MRKDPFGHTLAVVTVNEELTPMEVGDRMREFVAQKEQEAPMVSGSAQPPICLRRTPTRRGDAAWNCVSGGINNGE